jgi:predicted AlkP superfamily pyrophosphatase or phosphodiesterase
MIPSYPSKTFPNHYTLVTGLYPVRHGIVANSFRDPARESPFGIADRDAVEDGTWYGGEPLWVTAERQGMVAASFFWVGSEADVGGVRPSHWRRFDGEVANEARVDQVLAWLSLPVEHRPRLVTLYFSDTDDAGHRHGPDSPELEAAVARVDRMIGRLRMGLEALPHGGRVHLIVVSDHGMQGFGPADHRYLEDVTTVADLDMPERGPSGHLWVEGGHERVLDVRARINESLAGVTAYLPGEVPERLHYRDHPRLGDLVVVTDSAVVVELARDPERPARGGFTHGWDPAFQSMRALFVAAGPGLAAGVEVGPFQNVDVYPLVTQLLGLRPAADIDGDVAHWRDVLVSRR